MSMQGMCIKQRVHAWSSCDTGRKQSPWQRRAMHNDIAYNITMNEWTLIRLVLESQQTAKYLALMATYGILSKV